MEIMEEAFELEKEGRDIIHLEIGEPDFDTPEVIKKAAIKAIGDGMTNYTHSLGILPMREAVAEHYLDKYGVSISPDRVVVTSGTSPALLLIFSSIVSPGDEVILTNPCYACYPNFVKYVGGVPRFINVYDRDNYELDVEGVKKILGRRTKAILINSPSNPTGTVISKEKLKEIAGLGITVISDEIYHGLVYEGDEETILSCGDEAFVLNGFSKAYAMTGWRLGYLIAPKKYVRTIQILQQNLFISANDFVQHAGVVAIREGRPYVEEMKKVFDSRRKVMIEEIKKVGFAVRSEPKGAFYVMADIRDFSRDSLSFAFELLREAGVGATPGVDFGSNGEGFLRFSYA
ncbi:MAG: aminotransferase class I/II-fold pyridoxal phosphate-dependent enzyme, partial [Deltaproteobacteria bacterium]|nr:aminotransferase class I/II-fold pyridoxal phosphate-dependent enzyme [Deltaproteobacteria bacterium]